MEMDLTLWGGLRPLLGHRGGDTDGEKKDVGVNKQEVRKDQSLGTETEGERRVDVWDGVV